MDVKFSALYTFNGLKKTQVLREVEAGDIIAFAGIDNIAIGDTISSDNENPEAFAKNKNR